MTSIRIAPHLNGLVDAAQGGIASGMFAQLVGGSARVRLLNPIPLDADLAVHDGPSGMVSIAHDDTLIAKAEPIAPFRHEAPLAPSFTEALEASQRHPFVGVRHLFSDCVVCSPTRPDGIGVVFGNSRRLRDVLIAPLSAPPRFAVNGALRPEILWGALDCTSFPSDLLPSRTVAVTGQLTAHVERAVDADERLVVVGWRTGKGTRSHRTASAVLDGAGRTVASAEVTWVEVAMPTPRNHARVAV
ncbi:hypothetical protein FLP10_00645 [Agromyces intestinalis]|uniref:Thioesterase family protein n=1 Tax=Agromyces intestinalis TaxID=2592652 RepID=A0A5C1YBY5_9MICO|nr:hotdog fold domain-containing protein [Agromyces intestinalis]QEO13088.1 hypothetical protein FLP10_00645 [Agromyces intestinalis]